MHMGPTGAEVLDLGRSMVGVYSGCSVYGDDRGSSGAWVIACTKHDVLGRTTARHIVAVKYEMSIYINFAARRRH
jgi:hypothetical protein